MSKYQLKKATKQIDYSHIIFIQKNEGFKHAYYLTEDRIERLIENGEEFFILYKDDQFVGMTAIDAEIRIQLHFFSVLDKFKENGDAEKMLELLIAEIKKKEVEHQTIHCFTEKEEPLLQFLLKNGFEEVGFYKNRYQSGKDAVITEKKI